MLETTRPPQNTRREILDVSSGGQNLALHLWRPDNIKGAVFYFHGLQSHAGWLWEVGPRFADNDVALFVLDRRGSGISPGRRNEVPDVDTVMNDYAAAVRYARQLVGEEVPLTLFGHCLGGSFLAALLHDEALTTRYDAAVFCSTWLGRMHANLDAEALEAIAADRSQQLWDAGLNTEDFTDDARYRDFIDNDDLAIRRLTRRSRATLLELERKYLNPRRELPGVPTAFVTGTSDPIIDLDRSYETFSKMVSGRGTVLRFPTDKHYLFFTEVRDELVDWASTYTLLRGVDRDV
ncbi:hydrolase [Actinopolyspora erythraea]|uniref:Hydrolase n=1 Tax=Actinopolyspora erythraea TaxID=414996 RepID=A0A099D5I0_9ACTN|nr:alpha/beta fold hydrolase [Actinopolyspora erythraea]ASU78665.1 hydrolase [Actinopolyspora erythraea]KGI81423.1 hydrolase [Actinopolyspora erythraea]